MIDLDKCYRAMKNISIEGHPRLDLIAEAIKRIQENPLCLCSQYLGIKNYAGFGDQREDHEYGYGPRHGTIVFRIGRTKTYGPPTPLGLDEIYFLECVRDAGILEQEDPRDYRNKLKLNLQKVLERKQQLEQNLEQLNAFISNIKPDFQGKYSV